jgi:phage-related tail protein
MSKEIDRRLRYAGNRTSRDAARLIFKIGEREEDKLAKLQGEIDELRAEIKDNRGDFTYAEAQKRLQELEKELKGERSGEND